jgi:hypothetical protein
MSMGSFTLFRDDINSHFPGGSGDKQARKIPKGGQDLEASRRTEEIHYQFISNAEGCTKKSKGRGLKFSASGLLP